MPTGRGENEGVHILAEFAGPAIPEPGVLPPGVEPGGAENAGMHLLDELTFDASLPPAAADPQARVIDGLTDRERAALRLLVEGGSLDAVARGLGVTPVQARDTVLTAVEALRSRLRAS
jgi:hypothetical protein